LEGAEQDTQNQELALFFDNPNKSQKPLTRREMNRLLLQCEKELRGGGSREAASLQPIPVRQASRLNCRVRLAEVAA